jgi:hypothetical protein
MNTDKDREAFYRLPYDKIKFQNKMLSPVGGEGRNLYTYAQKCAVTQLKKQATDKHSKEDIEDLTFELIKIFLEITHNKPFDTMLDAYKYGMKVMKEKVSNEAIPLVAKATVPNNQVDIARSQGKEIESYRDSSGKLRYRPRKGTSGEWVDDTNYKLDPDHQAQFLGTQATPNDPRNDTDFDEWDGELVFNQTDVDLNLTPHEQAVDTVVGVVGLGAVASPTIGHNQPPEPIYEPPEEPSYEFSEETKEQVFKEASRAIHRLGLWDTLTGRERQIMRWAYVYMHDPQMDEETKASNWAWYKAGNEMGMSEESVRKIKSKITKKSKPSQSKLNNLKKGKR